MKKASVSRELKLVPNLDGMFVDEVKQYGDKIKDKGKHFAPVRKYCNQKVKAMEARLAGRINHALYWEKACDQTYSRELRGKVNW